MALKNKTQAAYILTSIRTEVDIMDCEVELKDMGQITANKQWHRSLIKLKGTSCKTLRLLRHFVRYHGKREGQVHAGSSDTAFQGDQEQQDQETLQRWCNKAFILLEQLAIDKVCENVEAEEANALLTLG